MDEVIASIKGITGGQEMSDISNGVVKVRYEGVSKVIEDLYTIGNGNVAIGKLFESTINSFKNDKILSI